MTFDDSGHTELDGGLLLTLLAVFREQLLPPSLHDKHVVDGDDIDVLDTLGLELVVSLEVTRDLVRACGGEATWSVKNQCPVGKTHAPGTRTITFFPVNLEKLSFSSMSLTLTSISGTASPAFKGEAAAREAKALWAVCAVAESRDAACQSPVLTESSPPLGRTTERSERRVIYTYPFCIVVLGLRR